MTNELPMKPVTGKPVTNWQERADVYNRLDWVRDEKFMDTLIRIGDFRETDKVLDVGTGTGLVAKAISPFVDDIIALDKSTRMLDLAVDGHQNIDYVSGDVRDMIFVSNVFDKVIARHIFHHVITGTKRAMDECYRVLKPGGTMIFNEGTPPSARTRQDYIDIFKLKEDRIVFMPDDMIQLMKGSGFEIAEVRVVNLEHMSIRNWLENSKLPKETQDIIYGMHITAQPYFWEDYCMTEEITEKGSDCFITMKMVILVGRKPLEVKHNG